MCRKKFPASKMTDSLPSHFYIHDHDGNVIWSSNAPRVASVTPDGLVTGGGAGNATITAKTEDGGDGVWHNGQKFKAKWYSYNEATDSSSAWTPVYKT